MMTPFEVQSKEFSKSLNGFNKSEVEDFLTKVSDMVESLMRENDYLKTQVSTGERKLTEYQSQENSLKEALLVAQITSNDIIKKAEAKSAEIKEQAESEAEKVLEVVKFDYINIEEATKNLRKVYGDFKQEYQHVLREQMKVLDRIEIDLSEEE